MLLTDEMDKIYISNKIIQPGTMESFFTQWVSLLHFNHKCGLMPQQDQDRCQVKIAGECTG